MARFVDWPVRLERAIREAEGRPFAWGTHDCMLWVAGVVEALTGVDHMRDLRGTYDSERGAARTLIEAGYPDLGAAVGSRLRAHDVPTLAQRGDVVLVEFSRSALGVVGLDGRCVLVSPGGLVRWPLRAATRAWAVE